MQWSIELAELQGDYGTLSISEQMMQAFWLRHIPKDEPLQLRGGGVVEILEPGEWNGLGGPDFLRARLKLNGKQLEGDVELHLRAGDWAQHRHQEDPAYNRVILHVVLADSAQTASFVEREDGNRVPVMVLLPYFPHDMGAFLMERSLDEWERGAFEESRLMKAARGKEGDLIRNAARRRWEHRCGYLMKRLAAEGWEAACHRLTLEVLGYRRNRAPMANLARKMAAEDFASADFEPPRALELESGWRLNGIRPASHPQRRLSQYAQLCRTMPNWRKELRETLVRYGEALPDPGQETVAYRKSAKVGEMRTYLCEAVCGGVWRGTRLDTLIVDAWIPLFACDAERWTEGSLFGLWYHVFPGDLPRRLLDCARREGICGHDRVNPHANGPLQGLLSLLVDSVEPGRKAK